MAGLNQTAGGYVAPSQNPILEAVSASTSVVAKGISDLGGAFVPLINSLSTFKAASATAKLAAWQSGSALDNQAVPETSILNPFNAAERDATVKTYFTYGALGLVMVGAGILLYKFAR